MTINVLPDNVLLESFDFYLGEDNPNQFDGSHDYDGWQTLVHALYRVCFTASPGSETLLHSTTIGQLEDAGYLASIAYCHIFQVLPD